MASGTNDRGTTLITVKTVSRYSLEKAVRHGNGASREGVLCSAFKLRSETSKGMHCRLAPTDGSLDCLSPMN